MLALTYWSYKDGLVQSAVMPYLKMIKRLLPAGSKIFLVTLEQSHLLMTEEKSRRVKAELRAEGIHLVAFGYSRFGVKAILKWLVFLSRLLLLSYRERISIIHAWCTPAGGAGYILSKLKKVLLVIDSYEPHAESMVELGAWRENGLAHRILFLLEKLQSRRAYAVIATTRTVREYAIEKYQAAFERFYVKPASVDLQLFSPAVKNSDLVEQFDFEGKLVCVYAGKIGGIYLEREIFDFFKAAADYWGPRFRVLLLTNADEEKIAELAIASGVDPEIITARFIPFAEVPRYMGLGDFAINPVRPIPTKKYCTSIKDGEYWAMGLPVVIPPNIGDDSDIIGEHGIGTVLKSFTSEGYRDAVLEIDELLKSNIGGELSTKIRTVAEKYRNLANTESIYRELYGEGSEKWRRL